MRSKEKLLEDVSETLGTLGSDALVAKKAANRLLDAMEGSDHEVAGTIFHGFMASAIAEHCRDAHEFRTFCRRMSKQFADAADRAEVQFRNYRS